MQMIAIMIASGTDFLDFMPYLLRVRVRFML
jgi:hypothetical protein